MRKFGPFFSFFSGGGRGSSQSTPGSSGIKIYNHVFLAHLNNGPGFYKLYLQEGTLLLELVCMELLNTTLFRFFYFCFYFYYIIQ